MKRYTVYDTKLGRYVVPLSKPSGTDRTPEVKTLIGGPQDLLFGEVVDHLAGLEIAVEEMEARATAPAKVYLVIATPYDHSKPQEVSSVWRSEEEAKTYAALLNDIGNGRDAHHWVAEKDVLGEVEAEKAGARPRGFWEYRPHEHTHCVDEDGYYTCSVCQACEPRLTGIRPPNFCRFCGADLRREADR